MPRKTVNIITPHYYPEITAAAHRMESLAKTLSSSFKVHVFTLAERGSKTENHSMKFDENLTVHYISLKRYSKSIFFIRAFFEWWYSRKLVKIANEIHADLAIVTVPFIFLLPVAVKTCNAKRKIADVRDLVWYYLPSSSFLKKFIRKKIIKWMHNSLINFNAITVTNEGEKKWLAVNSRIDEQNIKVISNGINQERYFELTGLKYVVHPQKFSITYVGNIGTSQQFFSLLDAVKGLMDVQLNLIGDGNELKKIKSYVVLNKIKNVFITGKLSPKNVTPFYQTSDLLFASLKKGYETAVPSKLYEYLSTGLPVLFQGDGAAARMLGNFENTFVYNGNDSKELEKIIWKIKRMSVLRSEKNMRIISKNFIREKLNSRFTELTVMLLNEKLLSEVFVEDILYSTEY